MRRLTLAVNCFSHFAVDFCCFYILFAADKPADGVEFLVYNTLAFALQFIVGAFCDAHRRFPASIVGVFLVAVALVLPHRTFSICTAALGNAVFHIGGGIDSLTDALGKMAPVGIFVSTGALGVSLGTLFAGSVYSTWLVPAVLLIISGVLLAVFAMPHKETEPPVAFDFASPLPMGAVIVAALASICIRSFAGFAAPAEWKTGAMLIFLASLAACLGKALGGVLADRFGPRAVGIPALIMSSVLLCIDTPVTALAGLLFFNMTMAINLSAIYSVLPENPGLSFGLTTLALYIGTLPMLFAKNGIPVLVVAALIVLSAALTYISSKKGAPRLKTGGNNAHSA